MQAITLHPIGRLHFDGALAGSNFMTLCDADTFEYRYGIQRSFDQPFWFYSESRRDESGRRWHRTSGNCVQDDFGNLVEVQ